jgi:hypothetical protein
MACAEFFRWTCDTCRKQEETASVGQPPHGWLRVNVLAHVGDRSGDRLVVVEVPLHYCLACGPLEQRQAANRYLSAKGYGLIPVNKVAE